MQDFWSPLQELIKKHCLDFDKTWQIRKRFIDRGTSSIAAGTPS